MGLVDTYKLYERLPKEAEGYNFIDAIFSFQHNHKLYKMNYWCYDEGAGVNNIHTLTWNKSEGFNVEIDDDVNIEELNNHLKLPCPQDILTQVIHLMYPVF